MVKNPGVLREFKIWDLFDIVSRYTYPYLKSHW